MSRPKSRRVSIRIDKVYSRPVGRIALASGATTKKRYKQVIACLDRMHERGQLDLLLAVKERRVSIQEVLDADRRNQLDRVLTNDHAPLWPSVEAWLGPRDKRGPTKKRYANSWAKLEALKILPVDALVSALERVDWDGLVSLLVLKQLKRQR